jgi:hypothetical protein
MKSATLWDYPYAIQAIADDLFEDIKERVSFLS